MFPKVGAFLINISRAVNNLMGNELTVTLSNHQIKLGSANPDKTDLVWDEMYQSGNIYFEDYANPIKPERPDTEPDDSDELNLITTDRYQANLFSDLRDAILSKDDVTDRVSRLQLLIVLGALQIGSVGILLVFVM